MLSLRVNFQIFEFHNPQIFSISSQRTNVTKPYRLKRKEADIDDWQRKKIAEAKQKMTRAEVRSITAVLFEMDRFAFLI